ncbi:hypothetical protein ACIPVK_04125 [Paeniglutamicibacter sp. MACA_103]|uniref:hypothetical protein n=1 Tax=Paeniglutamicibacter sp. MACA_103 TaxID=3377337 RepID=UPI003893711A
MVGFDRGGWSPALFAHIDQAGFDVLTWRKGTTEDIAQKEFTTASHTDEHGETRSWEAADTRVELLAAGTGELMPMRQISRIVPGTKGQTPPPVQRHHRPQDPGPARAGMNQRTKGNRRKRSSLTAV